MKTFTCNVAQKGFFAGPVHLVQADAAQEQRQVLDSEAELKRFRDAHELLKNKLVNSTDAGTGAKSPTGIEDKNADIREATLSILSDESFVSKVEQGILEQQRSASDALRQAANELTEAFEKIDSEYLRSRQDDVRGVANQLIATLEGSSKGPQHISAFVAEEISPAQLISADEALIGGMLTEKGSANSHAAILAGNLGIPYLYGNADAVAAAKNASFIVIDSEAATVIVDPDEETQNAAQRRMAQVLHERAKQAEVNQSAKLSQCRTKVCANIAGPEDIEALLASGADGVGLFRTEFLFIGREDAPSEEEQLQAYTAVLQAMGEKPVIIRTMDIGSDKKAPWLALGEESNPALGLRGARVSLERSDLFRVQLRALLRAGTTGNLKVMFPMIASAWEIDAIVYEIQAAAQELESEGVAFKLPELGIMVETPAAAVLAEELAQKVSFFSIGTNDLTQYTLAIDREARGLERYFTPHHEAVFRMIEMTTKGGHKYGVETGLCGQLGADPEAIERLIRIGVDELSVPIRKVGATKKLVSEVEARLASEAKLGNKTQPASGAEPETESKPIGESSRPAEHPTPAQERCQANYQDKEIAAAADGELVPMSQIPDAAFSSGSLGACFGIVPENGKIYAPIAGMISNIAAAKHAITITGDDGRTILVHVGIDTVKLNGKPFTLQIENGQRVKQDQLLMEADLEAIEEADLSTMIVVVELQ